MYWQIYLLVFAPLWAGPPAWDSLIRHEELWNGSEAVSVYFADRVDLQPLLEGRDHRHPEVRRLIQRRIQTNMVLAAIAPQILWTYLLRGLIDPEQTVARELVSRYQMGASRVLGVTVFADPFGAFETVGAGAEVDNGDGHRWTPTERRTVGRGMSELERSPIAPRKVKIRYIPPGGGLKFDEEVEAFLEKIPHWVGGYIELKGAARPEFKPGPHHRISPWMRSDFGPMLHRVLIRDHWTLYTEIPVPYPLPALQGDLKKQADALKAKYSHIPDELLYPNKQKWVIADKLVAHSVSAVAARLYEVGCAFDPPSQKFFDEDFGKTAYISVITRERFEKEAGDLFARRPGFRLVESSEVVGSALSPIHCSLLVDTKTYSKLKLPTNYVPMMRLADTKKMVVPIESPLYPYYRALHSSE